MSDHSRNRADAAPPMDESWTLGDLRLHWPALVGVAIADITKPMIMTANGVLTIRVRSTAAWLNELIAMADELIVALPATVEGVACATLMFVLDPWWTPPSVGGPTWYARGDDDDPAEAWKR